ncbi:MAG TPA: hypothetical protein ENJ95_10125 [Bacteroidetes bacterium]|nr:hypothetical protein [Bacteroidota bacterium]
MMKKVVLTGPESSGKTVLAEKLAKHYQTVWVPEYAREYCKKHGNVDLTPMDFAHIAGGQLLLEDQMAKKANGLLICDTDLISTEVWADYFLDECPKWIMETNRTRYYDLFLLLAPDIPWIDDGIRNFNHIREEHFEKLRDGLKKRGVPFEIISGDFGERFQRAVKIIDWMLR